MTGGAGAGVLGIDVGGTKTSRRRHRSRDGRDPGPAKLLRPRRRAADAILADTIDLARRLIGAVKLRVTASAWASRTWWNNAGQHPQCLQLRLDRSSVRERLRHSP
jgi:hypothetical protein